ncbi:MAG: hypothetical protein FWC61_04250 [Proteobacteria bacterium]|nr:hypothetical protein [Pseudomonadota bacterium]
MPSGHARAADLAGGGGWTSDADGPNNPAINIGTDSSDLPETGDKCAQKIFASALAAHAGEVSADTAGYDMEAWIYKTLLTADTIKKILSCPDIAKLGDKDTFTVAPVTFAFNNKISTNSNDEIPHSPTSSALRDDIDARTIAIRYSGNKKILNQRLMLAEKRKNPGGPSEKVDFGGDVIWVNTEPAWYGILIVQAGSLDNYIGENKNNTISVKYMADRRMEFFPKNGWLGHNAASAPMCVSGSAFANDGDIVNVAGHKATGEKPNWFTGNDYYVAGDVNLQWVTWAEVAGDVALTVATIGAGTAVSVAAKGARATRTAKNIVGELRILQKLEKVRDYNKILQEARRIQDALKTTRETIKAEQEALRIAKEIRPLTGEAANTAKLAEKYGKTTQEINELKRANLADREKRIADLEKNVAKNEGEIVKMGENAKELEKGGDVQKYKTAMEDLNAVKKLRGDLKAWKIPQRGNIIARLFKTARGEIRAAKVLKTAGRSTGKAGTLAGKLKDGLFKNSLKFASFIGRAEAAGGIGYGILHFVGEMYDWTDTSVGDYTSNIKFIPFGLLSADDLEGQENVVNRGMWLMWAGDSVSPEDDDAAYLQAMDFAQKFYEEMRDTQDELSPSRFAGQLCDVDIFVVRPIIRNPGSDDEIYYLIMNDEPWRIRIMDFAPEPKGTAPAAPNGK